MIITDWEPAVTDLNSQRCQAEISYARATRATLGKDRIAEIRAFDLRIVECERWLMILNRRATEALDAQQPDGITQREVDELLASLRYRDDYEEHSLVARMWTAIQTMQTPAREAELRDAFAAGWLAGENFVYVYEGVRPVSEPSGPAEVASAEYARSKVGG